MYVRMSCALALIACFISVALTLDDSVLTSHKTKVVTSGSKPTLGFHTPTDDHSRSPRALRFVSIICENLKELYI